MSMFGDYKSYKKYEPAYDSWKYNRDLAEAKRMAYLKKHPQEINEEDIQRGKTLIRAIDIMDEYSQKRAQDMEAAASAGVETALMLASAVGAVMGLGASSLKSVQKFLGKIAGKYKLNKEFLTTFVPLLGGLVTGLIVSFPLQAWTARAQVSASRKGRFEAMRKDLNSPNGFAILTPEQAEEAKEIMNNLPEEKEKKRKKISGGLKNWKELAVDSKEYKTQRRLFEEELAEVQKHIDDELTPEETENAKKEQQLLTKLVEKIDISSQDYAQNAEMAIGLVSTGLLAGGFLTGAVTKKILSLCKLKSAETTENIIQFATLLATVGLSIAGTLIAKDASRVGRFKVKQELLKHPETFVYVDDNKTKDIEDIEISNPKQNVFAFLKEAWKNRKEYNKYKETIAKEEKRFYQAVEKLKLSQEQLKDAKRLQRNTFMTFNTVDEKSQKYSESVEALGESVSYLLSSISNLMIITLMGLFSKKIAGANKVEGILRGAGIALISAIPVMLFNIYMTKEQKKASRVANMLAINEMSDYRKFR